MHISQSVVCTLTTEFLFLLVTAFVVICFRNIIILFIVSPIVN